MTAADRLRNTMSSLGSMVSSVLSARHDPAARMRNVDLIAVLVAVLVAVVDQRRQHRHGALACRRWPRRSNCGRSCIRCSARSVCFRLRSLRWPSLGTLWSDAPWSARTYALSPATKLLVLPFLFYHFERSTRGMWVFIAFLASCTLMTVASWIVAIRSQPYAEGPRRADGSRHLRQELYRPEPGIRCCARSCLLFPSSRCCAKGKSGMRCC